MKAVVAAFNQEKALVGAFSVIVQPVVEPIDRFAALTVILTWPVQVVTSIPYDYKAQNPDLFVDSGLQSTAQLFSQDGSGGCTLCYSAFR